MMMFHKLTEKVVYYLVQVYPMNNYISHKLHQITNKWFKTLK